MQAERHERGSLSIPMPPGGRRATRASVAGRLPFYKVL